MRVRSRGPEVSGPEPDYRAGPLPTEGESYEDAYHGGNKYGWFSPGLDPRGREFWRSSHTRSASATIVSLQDTSGKPLKSLFDGMRVDKGYGDFKRLVAERHASRCRRQPSRVSRLLREIDLWFEPVVQACSGCRECGFAPAGDPFNPCARACGAEIYDYDLEKADPPVGITTAPPVCLNGPSNECPGWIPTTTCICQNPTL